MFGRGMLSRWITAFQNDPATLFISLAIEVPAFLAALILHEISHGYVALWCGDGTARMMGRLSLRPSHHLDPVGSLCMVLFGFGWARPVPVNPRNFRNYVRDDFLVSIAGITMNLLLFFVSSVLLAVLTSVNLNNGSYALRFLSCNYGGFYYIYTYSGEQMVSSLFRYEWLLYIQRFLAYSSMLNLALAVFNLLPVPPLDGFHIVNDTILRGKLHLNTQMFWICQAALLMLCYSTNIIGEVISWAQTNVQGGLMSGLVNLLGMG